MEDPAPDMMEEAPLNTASFWVPQAASHCVGTPDVLTVVKESQISAPTRKLPTFTRAPDSFSACRGGARSHRPRLPSAGNVRCGFAGRRDCRGRGRYST